MGSNWYMDTGVRDLEVACFKVNSTWINDIGSKDLSNRPIYAVLNTHNLDMILQLKYMPIVMNPARVASSDWKSLKCYGLWYALSSKRDRWPPIFFTFLIWFYHFLPAVKVHGNCTWELSQISNYISLWLIVLAVFENSVLTAWRFGQGHVLVLGLPEAIALGEKYVFLCCTSSSVFRLLLGRHVLVEFLVKMGFALARSLNLVLLSSGRCRKMFVKGFKCTHSNCRTW